MQYSFFLMGNGIPVLAAKGNGASRAPLVDRMREAARPGVEMLDVLVLALEEGERRAAPADRTSGQADEIR